ncbi:hypothetical protein Fmac_030850 [Flemingia macrophylla]|uniref:Leucine-rich repeat-containing N-terminal plant-type domain-containing protein n=1 Tax=Flemingia macrophylla TaxID=520843 RepID=A0ABD1L0E3_9FABA
MLPFHMGWVIVSCLLLLYLASYAFSYSFCNHHDSSALLQFKYSFALNTSHDDFYWWPLSSYFSSKTESWKNGSDCCEWEGVTCDTISGHVIALDLSCSNLQGHLHPNTTLFSLTHLQQLNLAYNDFSGSSIPSGIGDLAKLTHLNFSQTSFSGDIPSTISHLINLVSLDLGGNDKMRPDSLTWEKLIHNATNLRELSLDLVDMSSIKESSLSLLTNLSSSLLSLRLSGTGLQGNLSAHILCLPNLQQLFLDDNYNLSGQLPKSNWSTQLRYLSLFHCNFDGLLPPSLFNLTQLSRLHLSGNKLVGPIPSQINKLSKLETLFLSSNNLNGTIPRWCYSLPSLLSLGLGNNHFTGSIGDFSSSSLEVLYLPNNKLQGDFPNSIFQLQNLTYLNLFSNNLSGLVDFHQFSKLKNLYHLDLSHNSFLYINFNSSVDYIFPNLVELYLSSCNINSFPKFLARLQYLKYLDLITKFVKAFPNGFMISSCTPGNIFIVLSFNKLQGDLPIPPNGIRYFIVSNNELTGNIPSTMCNASSLFILNLAHNNLTGLIPQCLGTLPDLLVLDLQMNNLRGSMPKDFSRRNSFETIKLNGNQLEGPLPRSLSHCTSLQVLDLGNNNLDDTFPH